MNCKSKQFDKAKRDKLKVRERTKVNGLSEELSDLNRFDRIDLFSDPPHCYSFYLQGIRSEMQRKRRRKKEKKKGKEKGKRGEKDINTPNGVGCF